MKEMVAIMFSWVLGVGLAASALAGGWKPDWKPGGEGKTSAVLTGAYQYTGETNTLANATLTSTTSDQNVILAQTNSYITVTNCVLTKSGDKTDEDNSNFYAVNAVVAAKSASTVCIVDSNLTSDAEGANCLFASGEGSTIYAYGCDITSERDHSRGLDATYDGTVIAAKMSIDTTGDHCAALATDKGNGSISVTGAKLTTAGQGSPLIYSTGAIEVNSVTGSASGAQIAGIEGLSVIRIKNSNLAGSGEQASEPVANGVIIYQSNSGDSSDGTATFEVSDSTLSSEIDCGAMFYITHSEAVITVQNTVLDFDASNNYLIKAAGNNGEHNWGTEGSNGAGVIFTAINQTLKGDISVDGISSNDLYLVNSTYTGTFVKDTTYTGDGGANVFIDADSTWVVTSNCTLKCLTATDGAAIVDADKKAVRIVDASGAELRSGTSDLEITVTSYVPDSFVATNITTFAVDRSAFAAIFGTSESEADDNSQSQSSKTYYFKPHAPTNSVVWLWYEGTRLFPDMDHKYWVDDYWTNGITVKISYSTDKGYLFADGSSETNWVVRITENKSEVYPPAGLESAYRAQAKSGSTYYRTLKEAIDAAANKTKIFLNDNVTLEETLTVTNSITFDLNATNVLTLGSALTNAFHFTAGATVSNGTINSSFSANVVGSVLMRFTDCKATLKDLTINGSGYECVVAHDSNTGSTEKYSNPKHTLDAVLCDGLVLTGNGCLLSVDYAKATLTNNCSFATDGTLASFGGAHAAAVTCSGNGTVTIADGSYAAPKVLQSGDCGGKIVVNGGTFDGQIYSWLAADADLDEYDDYKAQFTFNAGDYTDAAIAFAYADSFDFSTYAKGDGVTLTVPSGYAWEDNELVRESIAAGVESESYSDAQAATKAAAAINQQKGSCIAVPSGVGDAAAYYDLLEATVTSDNRVVVDLTSAAQGNAQTAVDAAVTNATVFASLVSADASTTATITPTTPGLYYWLLGGTDVEDITQAGASVLSTDGGAVELSKPTLDATQGKAFFRIAVGVRAPGQ